MSSSSVVMVCGESLFHFWELEAIIDDIRERPEERKLPDRYHRRNDEVKNRGVPSWYLSRITNYPRMSSYVEPIWDAVYAFASHYCSDPRDRVFGLLALADSESREAFSPDYTKSATAVLLQPVEHHAKDTKGNFSQYNFRFAHEIIGCFGLSPHDSDIAAMRDRRRTALHGEEPFSDITSTRDRPPVVIRENDPSSSDPLPRRSIPDKGLDHVVMTTESYCTVWKNDEGEFFAPLLRAPSRPKSFNNPIRHDFSTGRGRASDGIRLRTPDGSVVGLANKQIQHGDTILLFESVVDSGMFLSALIVRRYGSNIATIVGQCVLDTDVAPCRGGSGCICGDVTHVPDKEAWKILMSPEDLLVFIAQDLKLVHRQPAKFEVPMIDFSVDLEESKERLTTRVTSDEFSSYAMCES
jgi:hypothetical protein